MAGGKWMGIDSMERILQMFLPWSNDAQSKANQTDEKKVMWQYDGTMLTGWKVFVLSFSFSFGVRRTFTHLLRWMGKHASVLWGTLIDLSAIFWKPSDTAGAHWYTGFFFTDLQLTERSHVAESAWISLCECTNFTDSTILTTTKEDTTFCWQQIKLDKF